MYFLQALSTSGLNNDELTLINITSLQWSKVKINNGSIPSQRSSPHLASGGHGVFLFGGESVDEYVKCTSIHTHTQTYTHIHTYTLTHTHTHTHTRA